MAAETTTVATCAPFTAAAGSFRAEFDGEKVAKAATAAWLSGDVLQERVRGLRFRYTAGGAEWELYANGSVLMSSVATAGGLWPGCARVLGGCSGSAADAMRETFAGPAEFGALTLSDAQVSAIGWRVEGAVFLVAAMSGSLPPGLFTVPVPLADFNASAWAGVSDDLRVVPLPTVFGSSRFVDGTLEITSGDSSDRALLAGSVAPFPRRWPSTAPKWLVEIGSAPGKYRTVLAASRELTGLINPDSKNRLDKFVATVGPQLTGTCAGGSPTPSAQLARNAIIARKRGQVLSSVSLCEYGGGGHGPALSMTLQASLTEPPIGTVNFRNQLYYQTANESWSAEEDDDYAAYCKGFGEGDPEPASRLSAIVPKYGLTPLVDSDYHGPVCGRFRTSDTADLGCGPQFLEGMQTLKASCVRDSVLSRSLWKAGEKPGRGYKRYTERLLLPQVCPPSQRVLAFANGYPAPTTCDAAAEFGQAVALACHLSNTDAFPISDDPPAITGVDDLAALAKWVDKQGKRLAAQVSKMHFESVPKSVLDDFVRGSAGTGSIAGDAGEKRAQLYQSMLGVTQNVVLASGQLQSISKSLAKAYTDLKVLELQKDIDALNLARAQLALHRDIAVHATAAVSSIARIFSVKGDPTVGGVVAGVSDAAGAAAAIGFDVAELGKVKAIGDKTTEKSFTETRRALLTLESEVGSQYTNLTSTLLALRKSASETVSMGKAVASLEGKAQYEAAKGSGEDYFTDPTTGKAVPIPVNTVLKRQNAITERRYRRALRDAKYLAYLARLAIEQRLGVRLNTITTNVGALEPPAQWADDVCSLTGIDYKALRNPDATADGGVKPDALATLDAAVIADFADQYIGDYVSKLKNFVEYYNVQYPSKDGDDIAVLSLQDDFGSCVREAPNFLVQSASLETAGPPTTTGASASAWILKSCEIGDAKCLKVAPGSTVKNPPLAPTVGALAGYSWLYDGPGMPATPTPPSGGATVEPGPTATTKPVVIPIPKHVVAQVVSLEPGDYVLSWWDQARAADSGKATTAVAVPYRAQVLDTDGGVVASVDTIPFVDGAGGWSPRRTMTFKVTTKASFVVTLTSSPEKGAGSSILIGNVQLESNAGGGGATGYTGTAWTRIYLSNDCKGLKKSPVYDKFEHRCDASGCWKELVAPLLIDTSALNAGGSAFKGKLAAQNFNFRHVTLAVNLVGTGVRDCSSTPSGSCFGSGYLEYTLTHDAFNSGIVAWDGTTQFFNFGSGAIRHGKALTAERYITLPLSSADSGLLFTAATEKQEFRGRPLDGLYKLRIYDDPALRWSRLEDVQIVLKYRYWSVIQPQPPGG